MREDHPMIKAAMVQQQFIAATIKPSKRVLHVGCGSQSPHRLHPLFRDRSGWTEVRLDVDASLAPDIVCSTADMRGMVPSASFDAVWSSHNIEHLRDHEVLPAFREFRRVLRPGGFALVRCPDLDAVVEAINASGIETVAYVSPAGPITPLDMLFGHRASVARGNSHMAHHTAFTDERLGRMLIEAGFAQVHTKRASSFDLWAIAFSREEDAASVLALLAESGLDFTP